MRALAALVVVVVPVVAQAQAPMDRGHDLGNGMRIEMATKGITVIKDGQRATLDPADDIASLAFDKATQTVVIHTIDNSCAGGHVDTFTIANLEARLANSAAYVLHTKKDYKASAAGFAKAAAADPAWVIPAYNLASALTLLGDQDGAVAALAPWLASDPVATFLHVTNDPELRPLLARKELVALHAKTPGTSKLSYAGFEGSPIAVAVSPERGLVAYVHEEHSWGNMSYDAAIEIYDEKTGKLVTGFDVVGWNEAIENPTCEGCTFTAATRKRIDARAAQFQVALDDLGFSPATSESQTADWKRTDGDTGAPTTRIAYLSNAKLGVASSGDGTARVLRGNTVLATATGLQDRLDRVTFLPDQHLMIVVSRHPSPEGCYGYPEVISRVVTVP